jgi:hypothetical protein
MMAPGKNDAPLSLFFGLLLLISSAKVVIIVSPCGWNIFMAFGTFLSSYILPQEAILQIRR